MKNEIKSGKDKIVGKVKETTGKLLDNEELEFKGKMQSIKSDIGNVVEDMKDEVLEKANNLIDRVKDNKKNS